MSCPRCGGKPDVQPLEVTVTWNPRLPVLLLRSCSGKAHREIVEWQEPAADPIAVLTHLLAGRMQLGKPVLFEQVRPLMEAQRRVVPVPAAREPLLDFSPRPRAAARPSIPAQSAQPANIKDRSDLL